MNTENRIPDFFDGAIACSFAAIFLTNYHNPLEHILGWTWAIAGLAIILGNIGVVLYVAILMAKIKREQRKLKNEQSNP